MTPPRITIGPPTVGVDADKAQQIWDILVEADASFHPPLSMRTSGTQTSFKPASTSRLAGPREYFESIQHQHVIVAHVEASDEKIAGFMSFRPHYLVSDEYTTSLYHYVTTVIVRPEFRGGRITQRMYTCLLEDARQVGQGVATRTWSTNAAHIRLLHALDFSEVQRIPNDRGNGIDTVYFARNI